MQCSTSRRWEGGGACRIVLHHRDSRLVPARSGGDRGFRDRAYITEASRRMRAVGMTLRDLEAELGEMEAQVLGLIQMNVAPGAQRLPRGTHRRHSRDRGCSDAAKALSGLGLQLEGHADIEDDAKQQEPDDGDVDIKAEEDTSKQNRLQSDDIALMELVVRPSSELVGRSATDIQLRTRYGINLLAISREGQRSTERLRSTTLRESDAAHPGAQGIDPDFANHCCIPPGAQVEDPDRGKALLASRSWQRPSAELLSVYCPRR